MKLFEIFKDDNDMYDEFDDFIKQNRKQNRHIQIGPFNVYMRTTQRFIDGDMKRTVEIGSIESYNPDKRSSMFKETLLYIENSAKNNGYDGVYIESIVNEWLSGKLIEYGYHRVNNSLDNMYKSVV